MSTLCNILGSGTDDKPTDTVSRSCGSAEFSELYDIMYKKDECRPLDEIYNNIIYKGELCLCKGSLCNNADKSMPVAGGE